MKRQFSTLQQLFGQFLKLGPFCAAYTNGPDKQPIDPKRRIYHNIKGYTTANKPVSDLHPDDKAALKDALKPFISDCQALHDSL